MDADALYQFPSRVGGRGDDAARHHAQLDLRKQQFDRWHTPIPADMIALSRSGKRTGVSGAGDGCRKRALAWLREHVRVQLTCSAPLRDSDQQPITIRLASEQERPADDHDLRLRANRDLIGRDLDHLHRWCPVQPKIERFLIVLC